VAGKWNTCPCPCTNLFCAGEGSGPLCASATIQGSGVGKWMEYSNRWQLTSTAHTCPRMDKARGLFVLSPPLPQVHDYHSVSACSEHVEGGAGSKLCPLGGWKWGLSAGTTLCHHHWLETTDTSYRPTTDPKSNFGDWLRGALEKRPLGGSSYAVRAVRMFGQLQQWLRLFS